MRRVALAAFAIAIPAIVSGATKAAPDTEKLEHAYTIAQDCYVAYIYGGLPDKARQAFQMSQAIGHALGKSDKRIAEDRASLGAMTRGDFSRDATSHPRLLSECAEVGL